MELLFKRLAWGDPLAQEERDRIVASVSRVQSFGPGETIVPAETRVDFSSVLLKGLSARQKVLKKGNRQITAFHLAGDFCDLHTYVLKILPDSVVAMSECEVAVIPHAQLDKIVRNFISYYPPPLGIHADRRIDVSPMGRFNRKAISGSAVGAFILRAFPSLAGDWAN